MRHKNLFILLLLPFAGRALAQPAQVTRVLHTIDFEERRLGNPEALPMQWVKVEGSGLPHYVNGRLTTDRAHGGQYSFRFDLNGGSLIYRYNPGQIKVQAGAHYLIEGYVQTSVMPSARARIAAYLADVDGHPLARSFRYSSLYAAKSDKEGWTRLSIEINCDDARAASVVLELGLLQPTQYAPPSLGERTLFKQDIHGTAWFDDITVSQVPHVRLTTERSGNIFRHSDPLRLHVLVSDRFTDDLAAQIVIRDAEGHQLYQRSGAAELSAAERPSAGQKRMTIDLPELPPGWYEVSLLMSSQGQRLGDQKLAMIRLADDASLALPDDRFGVIATDLPFDGWSELPEILPLLGVGRVKLAVWSHDGDVEELDSAAFDAMLVRFQELHIIPTACLLDLPPALALQLERARQASEFSGALGPRDASATLAADTGSRAWLQLLKANPEQWREPLAYLIARHANHLDRWQLGTDGSDQFVTQPQMRKVYDVIYNEFAKLVDKPDLAMPWPAWYELEGKLPATVALSVPTTVLPTQLPLYMQDIRAHKGHKLSLSLQLLGSEQYGRQVQVQDLAERMIYALAAGAERIDIPLSFTVRRAGDDTVEEQPKELFIIARTLMRMLAGSVYRGRVPIAEGVEAFLFDRRGQGVLVMWDTGRTGGVKPLAVNLGAQPTRVDLWGNATPLLRPPGDPGSAKVMLTVGPTPIFLTDIDGPLMQLRASIGLDNPLIESTFQSHKRHFRFTSSYRTAVGGSLKLRPPPGWTLTPSIFNFTLNPGETLDREITIEFPYNSFAGPKTIEADFIIQAEKTTTFTVPVSLKLGLSDVGMQTLAFRDGPGGTDVVVQQIIQNYGDAPIDYTAFAIFPGQARQERLVTGLAAGRATIKRYRFTHVDITRGAKVRVGVKEFNGTRILNDEVEIQ